MFSLWTVSGLLFAIALLCLYYFRNVSTKNDSSRDIPGPQPSNAEEGNFPDIKRAGNVPLYQMALHREFGPIVRFWFGPSMAVSIGSPQLLKEHSKMFDRPVEMFRSLAPLISNNSIQFTNGEEGRQKHTAYKECFTDERMKRYLHIYKKTTAELLSKWNKIPEGEHISIKEPCFEFAIASILWGVMGEYFRDKGRVSSIRRAYDMVWSDLEKCMSTNSDVSESEVFVEGLKVMHDLARDCMSQRRLNPSTASEHLLIDAIMELDMTEEATLGDIITMIVAGFHTSAWFMVWAIYYLGSHQEVQEKVRNEIAEVLGQEELDHENVLMLQYLHQVLNETLRCSLLTPFIARVQETDGLLGGYHIPAGTSVAYALGAIYMDPSIYPDPERFDPDRFSPANAKNQKLAAFKPFGHAGGRMCPGYRFALMEAKYLLVELLRRYRVVTVNSQNVTRQIGFMTIPSEDVWITLEKHSGN